MKRMIVVRKLERSSSLQLGIVEWLEMACWVLEKHQFVGKTSHFSVSVLMVSTSMFVFFCVCVESLQQQRLSSRNSRSIGAF